jgi:tryptophanyl-tRNA synthetase
MHLGNHLGAIRPMVDAQHDVDSIVLIADLHALTREHDPTRIGARTRELAILLLAAGVDPARSLLYVQSHVPEHTELHYLLECATRYGEAHRMIQFKEQAGRGGQTRLSLLTYPVLMAGDILLHDADEVPVGDDQDQHVELARDVAVRINRRYGAGFVVPKAVHPTVAARIMDLADPGRKMDKSAASDAGVLYLLDPPDVVRRKVRRAVTDAGAGVRYAPVEQPGVANLLEILAGCVRADPAQLARGFDTYGGLKGAVADAVISTLRPIQQRYADIAADPGYVSAVLRDGAARARERGAVAVRRGREAFGLLEPGSATGLGSPIGPGAGRPAPYTPAGLTDR